MNSNLKKLFGFAAITACSFGFAMNVNAAIVVTGDTCAASNVADLKDCVSAKGDYKDVKKVTIDSAIVIDENITNIKNIDIDAGANNVTIKSGNTLTITNGSLVTTGDLEVQSNANLNVTSDSDDAVKAANIKVLKGKVTVSADNTNGVVASDENTANALNATTKLTIDGGVVTVSKGAVASAAIEVKGKSTITADDIEGAITVENSATDTTASTIKANDITGDVTLNDKASLTANKITGDATANENSTINAKEITGAGEVNGKEASIQYASENSSVIPTQGVIRQTTVDQYGDTHVEVQAVKVDAVKLAANETLIIKNTTYINKDFAITAAKGAKIDNQTSDDLNLSVNGSKVVVSKDDKGDDAYVVADGATEEPGDKPGENPGDKPGENPGDKPNTGDDQPSKNPQTFDGILSYVGVALSSVGGLGVSLKKRLFR